MAQSLEESNLKPGQPDPQARAADIALGQPHPDDVIQSNSLRWVHLTSAGYTRYDRPDVAAAMRARGAMMTTSSGVYSDPCAQHVLSFMLANVRKLGEAQTDQAARRGWSYAELRPRCQVLTEQTALIVGFGSIGRRLVELLAPFRMRVIAIRRTVRGNEPVQTAPSSRLEDFLPQADHIINLLPSGADSARLFDARRFALMKRTAVFYNVGRGDTVDQAALRAALQSGQIAASYLDVTMPEPLPADDPLWSAPNCHITPHLAGGQQHEIRRVVEHFIGILRRFEQGQELLDRVI